ncbi:MAG: DUF1648 domain-containing protein [Spirochaetia bacterium]|nr:DUF1648 domain-containing protein [Spirochaetia bacterium]
MMPWRALHLISTMIGIILSIGLSFFLPDRVATHFDIYGHPDSWASNLSNTILFCGLFVFFGLLFSGVKFLLGKLPASLINMPNREYWFAPERREASLAKVAIFMAEFGFFANLFFTAILFLTFYANRNATGLSISLMLVMLAAFLVFVIGWIIHLYRAFKLPN